MASITLPLSELPAFLAARSAALSAADLTKPLKVIRQLLISATKQNFVAGASPDGVPWAPLKYRQGQPLRDTGMLMASLSAGGTGSIDELTSTGLRYGSSLDYAGVQNFGATISQPARTRGPGEKPWVFTAPDGRKVFTRRIRARTFTVPARPFLGLTVLLRARINSVLQAHISGLLGGTA